ncbi:MAG: restriction endonuclease subunit S, partial [Methylococcales bacterium]|nr:restriction endonuclease subunit S [Methylococcales bacterium]
GLIRRGQRGAAQPGINLSDIATVLVPLLGDDFQTKIEASIKRSRSLVVQSHSVYAAAEKLLLDTLGMADYKPKEETINVKSLSESIGRSGRIDAEYYQPKYEQVISRIKATSHAALTDLVCIKKSIEPGSDAYTDDETGLPFLRVADYSKYGINKPQKSLTASFVSSKRAELDALIPKKNTILISKDGSVGEAYCLREDMKLVTSSAILHLTVRDPGIVLPDYLTLVLNSILVKMQAERDSGGSVILHWRTDEISKVVVPLVAMATQQKIAELLKQSFELKAEGERLLTVASRAVEVAIGQDEKSALAYLDAQG